nr:CNNM domain-containing protein [Gammaproteobacteria bacterium]
MSDYTLLILYASLALGLSFLCSILEAVLLSTTRSHILALKDTHKKTSELWIGYKDDPERPLTAILTLNTTAHTVGALGVGYEVQKVYPEYSVAVASAILTIAILLLSEILPKTIGALYWRRLTVPSATALRVLIFVLWIFVWTIQILRSFLPKVTTEEVTRIELAVLADIAEESNVIEKDEELVIQNLLRLREIMVGEVMTPRRVMKTV